MDINFSFPALISAQVAEISAFILRTNASNRISYRPIAERSTYYPYAFQKRSNSTSTKKKASAPQMK